MCPPVDLAEAALAILIIRILASISVGRGPGDDLDYTWAVNPHQLGQLILQSSVPVGGHVKSAVQPEARSFVVVHSQPSLEMGMRCDSPAQP